MIRKALVLGWYGKGNAGDESYKLTLPWLLTGYELTFTDSLSGFQHRGDEFDLLILGGGDIFSVELLAQVNEFKRQTGVECISLSVSLSEVGLSHNDSLSRIYVRDEGTVERLSGSVVQYLPDAAFILEGNSVRGEELMSHHFAAERRDLYENRIAVVVNSHLIAKPGEPCRKHAAFQHFAQQLAHVADHTNASFFFIPFGTQMPWDDRCSEGYIASLCKFWKKNLVMFAKPTVQDTLDLLAASNVVISTRLHSSIFSCATATNFVDITHNHKNRQFLIDTGLSDCSMSYLGFDPDVLTHRLSDLLLDSSELVKRLIEIRKQKRRLLAKFRDEDVPLLQQKTDSNRDIRRCGAV